ncbi:hypothetical protein PMZ80_003574 [Knufia obscura]|uniref:FAD-binding domain-containing protein n=2 Tax=Knufia TaxID=430999 RepID=A0AAN8EQ74_9EURO|nr:hypothetical protein PMZ80_003574 [Knufia obscura]KAK5958510.1 hypothetical protein OHC33_000353 [Knufia fluminis]
MGDTLQHIRPSIPRISIIGAGISGLILACRLQNRKIPCKLYEARTVNTIGHNYAITLQWAAIKRLKKDKTFSKDDLTELRRKTAVDRAMGGNGRVSDHSVKNTLTFQAVDRDFRKWLLDHFTRQGGEVSWNHKLTAIRAGEGGSAELLFENQDSATCDLVVDAGGLKSPCFNYIAGTEPMPRLLPYATYYGTRKMSSEHFLKEYAHYFGTGNTVELGAELNSDAPFISLQKVHLGEAGDQNHEVELRWVYSRPAKAGSDPLYRPNRTPKEAKEIPHEFYDEILKSVRHYFSPTKRSMLQRVFDLNDMQNDRILNWHLRVRLPEGDYFLNNSQQKNYEVLPMGDAAHELPVVKSRGAVKALHDARRMARCISYRCWSEKHSTAEGYLSRHKAWYADTQAALQELRRIHGQEPLMADELADVIGHDLDEYEDIDADDALDEDYNSAETDFNTSEEEEAKL